jgi:hypothetical protein
MKTLALSISTLPYKYDTLIITKPRHVHPKHKRVMRLNDNLQTNASPRSIA